MTTQKKRYKSTMVYVSPTLIFKQIGSYSKNQDAVDKRVKEAFKIVWEGVELKNTGDVSHILAYSLESPSGDMIEQAAAWVEGFLCAEGFMVDEVIEVVQPSTNKTSPNTQYYPPWKSW